MNLPNARHGERAILILGALVAAVCPVALYWPTYTSRFGWALDDFSCMGMFGALSFNGVLTSFLHTDHTHYYRPLHVVVTWILTQTGGTSRLFEAGSLHVLHLVGVGLLYYATSRISRSRVIGVLTAALWSVSSVHLPALLSPPALIPERLCALCLGAAMALFLTRRWKWTPLPLVVALFSKEWGVMIAPILTMLWALMLAEAWQSTGRLKSSEAFEKRRTLAVCWVAVAVYMFFQVRYGVLERSGPLTPGVFEGKAMFIAPVGVLWRVFTCDMELNFYRTFEFLLWPVLPGHSYNSVMPRSPSPSQPASLVLLLLGAVFVFDVVALVRSRKTAILRPRTYFGVSWFLLATMPVSLQVVRRTDIAYLPILPAMAALWLLASTLRRLQGAAIPGFAAVFVVTILAAYSTSLGFWYPHGIQASHWARARLATAGRLDSIAKDIGPIPRRGPAPAIVLVGLEPDGVDQLATSAYWGGAGLTAYYRRPITCRPAAKRADLWVTSDRRLAIRGRTDTLPLDNIRILEKQGSHYVDITALIAKPADAPTSRSVQSAP